MKLERRATQTPLETRASDGGKIAAGYAALFNSRTNIADAFIEVIAPGAFAETLKTADVRALIDHDSGRVIGRSSSGTLRLDEDDKGLGVEIDLPDTSDGRDLAVQLDRGDITGMSFSFRATHDEWDDSGDVPVRTIHQAELFEVSAVAFPAYEDTEIALRSLEGARKEWREHSDEMAKMRVAARRARAEQKFRKIN